MKRTFIAGALVGLMVIFAVELLGRAIDQEVQERVILTRSGVTLDCERRFAGHGSVSYDDCHQVP